MKHPVFHKNVIIVFLIDILLLSIAFYVSYLIRFDFQIPYSHRIAFLKLLPYVLITKIVCFFYFDLYRGMWRYTSLTDLFNIIKASSISTLLIVGVILFSPHRFLGFPRSVFIIDWCLTILFISGFRLFVRFFYEYQTAEKSEPKYHNIILRTLVKEEKAEVQTCSLLGPATVGRKFFGK